MFCVTVNVKVSLRGRPKILAITEEVTKPKKPCKLISTKLFVNELNFV